MNEIRVDLSRPVININVVSLYFRDDIASPLNIT